MEFSEGDKRSNKKNEELLFAVDLVNPRNACWLGCWKPRGS